MKLTSSFFQVVLCRLLVTVFLFMSTGCLSSSSDTPSDDAVARAEIRALLREQVNAWNRGDLTSFMESYARIDSLRFASGGDVHRGWQTALARYRKAYPDRAAMGTLAFSQLDVQMLTPRSALVFGAWQLTRADDAPHGLFTLLLKQRPEGWRIVHDHTSSARGA